MSSSDTARYTFEPLDAGLVLSPGGLPIAEPWERERVLAEGREEGLAEARELARPALEALGEAIAGLEALRAQVVEQLECDAVAMAFDLAEQILGAALEVAPQRVLDVIRGALRRLGERRHVTVVVNPDDHALVGELIDELRDEAGGIEHIVVIADRRVERGGVIVRTEEGEIDAQIRTQIARARAIVAQELASA
jgi:flagellar assembly protein FliH